jgi:murein DD-endopeptidase MepM/ murein hydrolase activator NlpD
MSDRRNEGRERLFRTAFQEFGRADSAFAGGGTATLSLTQALPAAAPFVAPPSPGLRERFSHIDWAPDLGNAIGTRDWWRGLATLALLCGGAVASWPGIRPLEAHAATLSADDWDYARAQTIAPLAWGGDTGQRMAATDAVQPLTSTPERPRVELTATLGQGDSFARLLERAGVGGGEASRVTSMVSNAVSLGSIAPGTRIDIVLGRRTVRTAPRPLESLAFRAALDLRLELARDSGALALERIPIAVDNTPLRIRGRVGDSLYRAARAAGAPMSAIQSYLRVIGGQLSVGRDVTAGDEFDIIVAHRRAETGEVEVGDLLYAGLVRGGRPRLRMLPWTVDGREQWFEAAGVGQQRGGMAQPANGRITSTYGMRRHPVLGYMRMHRGIDFGAPSGSPIYAVTDGVVNVAGYNGGFGRFVRINHAGGIASGYGHMSRIAVRAGQQVRRGQVIGYVGSSGLSTGPHLHYELYRNGVNVNPMSVRFVQRAQLAGRDLAAFRARLAQLTSLSANGAAAPVRSTAAQALRSAAASPTARAGDVIIRPPAPPAAANSTTPARNGRR